METFLQKHYDKKTDQLNAAFRELFDTVRLSAMDCDAVLTAINEKLPGEISPIAHKLRRVLCLSMDVIAFEDAIVSARGPK